MAELKPKLQLSKGFDLDLKQTARLLQWLDRNKPTRLSHEECAEDLGLPQSKLEHIASHSVAMGLILPRTGQQTALGKALMNTDPYLTGHITPWILHYNVSAEPRCIVWHRMVNDFIQPGLTFSADEAREHFADLQDSFTRYSAAHHLNKELRVFLNAYTDGALSRLAFIERTDGGFSVPSSLRVPPVVFGYSLLTFPARYRPGETAISVYDIAAAMSSPGRIFLMREPDVRTHLERLHRNDVVSIENKGHLDQVRFVNPPDPAEHLLAHFEDTED